MAWLLALGPPFAFLMVLVLASAYASRRATSGEEVAQRVQNQFPLLLAITLGAIGLALAWLPPAF